MDVKLKMKRWTRYAAIALLSGTTASVLVADTELPFKPGLWEFTSTAESLLPGADGTDVSRECITTDLFSLDEMKAQLESTLPGGSCDIDRTEDGSKFFVKMVCTGGGGVFEGEGSYTIGDGGESMEGEMVMKMEFAGTPVEIVTKATAKRLGDC